MTSTSSLSENSKQQSNDQWPVGQQRFEIHLSKLSDCLKQAATSENVALALYQSPARQWFFYLEALARIYKKTQNKKPFKKLDSEFKLFEDQLGTIDFWDGWVKEFSAQQNFPSPLLDYFKMKMDEEVSALQKMVDVDHWISKSFQRVHEISEKLSSVDWNEAEADSKATAKFLVDDLKDFEEDYESGKLHFDDLENGVHEFRRQLRWFSIYAQALDGLIQLKPVNPPPANLQSYMTGSVMNSPFNKMPLPKAGAQQILIEAPNFYALSWIINELGEIKDRGLRIKAVMEAAIETGLSKKKNAESFAMSFATDGKESLENIPALAKKIADKFLNEDKVLKRIRADISNR